MGIPKLNRLGEIHPTHHGDVEIIQYDSQANMKVRFLNTGTIVSCSMGNLKRRHLYDPYSRTQHYGKGYLGEGDFSQNKYENTYTLWKFVLRKAYCEEYKKDKPSYETCYMSKVWHSFQLFAEDVTRMRNYATPGFDFDKDLIKLGNKRYHKDFCSFVPAKLNKLLNMQMHRIKTTGLPMGVRKTRNNSLFEAQITMFGKNTHLGTFSSIEKAQECYANTRAAYVHKVAEIYKKDVDPLIYENLSTIQPEYFIRK